MSAKSEQSAPRRASALCAGWRRLAVGGLIEALMASGCAVGPNFVRPAPPPVTHYSYGTDPAVTLDAQGVAQRFERGAAVPADWWRLLGSSALDRAVSQALVRNPGLQAAEQSLRASQDALRAGYGVFYPQIEADASATRQRYTPAKIGLTSVPPSLFNLFSLSGTVGYVLDVFGGERRRIEGLRAQDDVQRAIERATYVALTSNMVNALIARAAYGAEVDATRKLIALQQRQVDLAKAEARAGTAPYSNVLSLLSQLATYEATIPQLQQNLAASDNLLATLAGYTPAQWRAPGVGLADLKLPRDLPVSLPSQLVRQRPDVLEAEATAHGASANIGVATASLLPSVTLAGSYGVDSTRTNELFVASGAAWDVGASLSAPLFQGGTLWFQRKAAIDDYRQAMALYRQTVLNAFGQVSNTLLALEHDAAALRADDEALAAARQALELVHANFKAGLVSYLGVLTADAQYHQAEINEIQAVAVRYQDTVALYVALGGGWWSTTCVSCDAARKGVSP